MKSLYSEKIKVVDGNVSGEGHSIEIYTDKGNKYKTSMFDESTFKALVSQCLGDEITEIRVKTSYVNNFKESKKISDWLKLKLTDIITINR